jgi:formiminotetrahydrofolate cyclodeaminase
MSSVSGAAASVARAEPPVGAGVVAAGVAELAAGLCQSIAHTCASGSGRAAPQWDQARGAAVQAVFLRARAERAASANALAYAAARDALGQPAGAVPDGDVRLQSALTVSAETLLEIEAVAVDCAVLAAEIAAHCIPELRADAAGAAELAATAGRTAAALVEINLAVGGDDQRRRSARILVEAAVAASGRAREAVLD